jgi:hypothetical protein
MCNVCVMYCRCMLAHAKCCSNLRTAADDDPVLLKVLLLLLLHDPFSPAGLPALQPSGRSSVSALHPALPPPAQHQAVIMINLWSDLVNSIQTLPSGRSSVTEPQHLLQQHDFLTW